MAEINDHLFPEITKDQLINDKLVDAQTPGAQIEFDPEEAEKVGAFPEDSLSEKDALESTEDIAPPSSSDNTKPE